MVGVRELLAIALGTLLGLFCIFAPTAVYRLSVLGGANPTRSPGGEYGSDPDPSQKAILIIRAIGVACLAIAVAIVWKTVA